jgi:hypothetical protein
MQRDPTTERIELAVFLRQRVEEGRRVIALLFELLEAPEPDEQIEVDGRGGHDLHLVVAEVHELVVIHVRDVERGPGQDVVPTAADERCARPAQDVERLLAVAVPSGVRSGRHDHLAEVRPVRREADLLADEHRELVLVGRFDPGQVTPTSDDRRALDVRGVALARRPPVGREVSGFQAGDGPPGSGHSSPAGLSGWRSIWWRPSCFTVKVSWIAR